VHTFPSLRPHWTCLQIVPYATHPHANEGGLSNDLKIGMTFYKLRIHLHQGKINLRFDEILSNRLDTLYCQEYAQRDKSLFMYLAKLSQTTYRNIALKMQFAATYGKLVHIPHATRLHVTEKDGRTFLVVGSSDGTVTHIYSQDDLAKFDKHTMMMGCGYFFTLAFYDCAHTCTFCKSSFVIVFGT
jgi:hypothetical protein